MFIARVPTRAINVPLRCYQVPPPPPLFCSPPLWQAFDKATKPMWIHRDKGTVEKAEDCQGDKGTTRWLLDFPTTNAALAWSIVIGVSGTNNVVQAIDKLVIISPERTGAINAHPGEIEKFPKLARFGRWLTIYNFMIFKSKCRTLPTTGCTIAISL